MKKVLHIYGVTVNQHNHGGHECIYACAPSEMTQIMMKPDVESIALQVNCIK